MEFKRFFALALAALLVMSLFAGCSKNSDTPGGKTDSSGSLIDQTKPAATTAKYAYQADYLDLQLPENVQYVNTMCTAGTTIFLTAYVQGDEIVQTDPDTGDTWSYYTQELVLLSVDPDTGACTQLPNLQLPTVPEDCEGNVDCYNMAGSDDGTLWMLVNVYAAKYDLPADFDPNTMNSSTLQVLISHLLGIYEDLNQQHAFIARSSPSYIILRHLITLCKCNKRQH